ncbi:MAG TPA: C2 domain-containing protein [Kofleriaceae bacterium]|nr:C2 domain-containing protein [Kofleriaceae bacterium]
MVLVFVTVFTLVAACSSDDGGDDLATPFCGDGACNGAESHATCATDCPATGPVCGDRVCNGGETSSTCLQDCPPVRCTADPSTCSGETICLNGTCVAAFGRVYTITVVNGRVPLMDPAGESWDPIGGAPDPYAVVTLNGVNLGMTPVVQDNFNPVWNTAAAPQVIPAGSTLFVDMFDQDVDGDDGIVRCSWMPISADTLHAGTSACTSAIGDITVRFSTQ